MYLLRAVFILFLLISLFCMIYEIRNKRRNIGFIIVSAMIALSNIVYFFLVGVNNAKEASNVLLPFYILHSWILFAAIIMLVLIEKYKRFIVPVVISFVTCLYQTYLVICQYSGGRIFSFAKRIYFGKGWWVVADTVNTGLFASYRSYRIMGYINLALVAYVLIVCMIKAHRIFKLRYYIFTGILALIMLLEFITIQYSFPVWINGLVYDLIPPFCIYLVSLFAKYRLRDWSLDSFANYMSDGLILYDSNNDLIHINDMIKNTLKDELLESFKDRTVLNEWIDQMRGDDDEGIITYGNAGRKYYFKVSERKIGGLRSSIGTLYILHDTTNSIIRIKAMERANEELERASKMKSDFLANMSHEIRTPMNSVIGMTEIALREKDNKDISDYLRQIQSSGHNLLNIINDILDYSKIESGKMEIIDEEYIPFFDLIDIANVLSTRIGEKNLELFLLVKDPLPHVLLGDAMRIRQVIINLGNNAIKFTREGSVVIELGCEKVSEDTVNLIFHIKDTGIGIKEEDICKLFISFQQLDSKRNRAVEGTGLGLAISQRLVMAMGGNIGVESKYGEGSDFWFTVPQKIVDDTDDITVINVDRKRAFVINDDPEMVKMFIYEMERLGVKGESVSRIEDYIPTGNDDFIFIVHGYFDLHRQAFFRSHPDVRGIILVDFGASFNTDIPNVHPLYRPETTMGMVQILNEKYGGAIRDDGMNFRIDYTAPDAKILVVDDNEVNLTILEGLLAPVDIKPDKAIDGKTAIEMVKNKEYDIVFMDHMMPEMDGIETTKAIREMTDIEQPVIIAVSANAMPEARKLFLDSGMEDFVAKPVDIRVLTTTVKKWLPSVKVVDKDEKDIKEIREIVSDAKGDVVPECESISDYENAVRALGSVSLYNKIADEYYTSGADRLAKIENAYETEDWKNYTIRVHSLKSSSRQIGAMALGDMAAELETAGNAGDIDTIKAKNAATVAAYRKFLDELSRFYGKKDDTDPSAREPIGKKELDALLNELKDTCNELDMDSMEEISDKLKKYSYDGNTAKLMEDLHKAVAGIDTEKCEEICDLIINSK